MKPIGSISLLFSVLLSFIQLVCCAVPDVEDVCIIDRDHDGACRRADPDIVVKLADSKTICLLIKCTPNAEKNCAILFIFT